MPLVRNVPWKARGLTRFKGRDPPSFRLTRESFLRNETIYDALKYVIPGTVKGTTVEQIDLKLKQARSNPHMVDLMSSFKYDKILSVAELLVTKTCRKAADLARTELARKEGDSQQSLESGKDCVWKPRSFQSTTSKDSPPTTTSDAAVTPFDMLLKEHQRASKSISATSVVTPDLEQIKVSNSVRSLQPTGQLVDAYSSKILKKATTPNMIVATNASERFSEKELEEMYQVLKPHFENSVRYTDIEPSKNFKRKIRRLRNEGILQRSDNRIVSIAYYLAIRGLFLVRYLRFPTYREASVEACRLVPEYAHLFTPTKDEIHALSNETSFMASTRFLDRDLEKTYQILMPHLKGIRYLPSEPSSRFEAKIQKIGRVDPDVREVILRHGFDTFVDAAYSLAFRGVFLVDYDKFPSYREASVEACRLVPEHAHLYSPTKGIASDDIGSPLNGSSVLTPQHSMDPDGVSKVKLSDTDVVDVPAAVATQQDFDSGSSRVIPPKIEDAAEASRKLQPPSPWELPKLPHLDEFERTTSPNMIPDLWKMRFFPTQENLEIVEDIDSDTLEIEPIRLPFLQELESVPDQDTELDVTGLRMCGTEPPQSPETPQPQEIQEGSEASEPLLQQEENSVLYTPDEYEIASNEDFDKPSKFLTVRGIRPSVSMKQLFERFASFHPVNIRRYVPNSAQVEFVDIEAATKALNGMHGAFVGGRFISCSFKSDLSEERPTGAWIVASEPPVSDYKQEPLSTHGTKQHQDALGPLTTTITETITEVPTESTKQAVIETLKDVTTEAATEAAIEAPTETTAQGSSLSPDSDLPDPSTPIGTISTKEGKKSKRVGRVRRGLKKGPVESTIDKPLDPTKDQQVEAERHDGLLYRGDADYKPPQYSSTSQATPDDFETDDITDDELIASDEPCISNRLESKPPWAVSMTDYSSIRKPRSLDHILPEITQLSTIPVPVTRAYWLPHSTQIQVLCGLQALAERVCFRYLQRKHPEILKETATQWGIDSPHVLELNQYIHIFRTLVLPDSDTVEKGFGSRIIRGLRQSMVLLRHTAVHRRIQDLRALRGWAIDGFKLAKLLDDPEAAEQFLAMALYLRTQYHKIRGEKMKAEEKLMTTLKELAAKRAELDRAEREAMDAFEEDHKQVHKVLDANVPLDPEPGINLKGTSSIKPASGIFGKIKSWLGA